MTPNTDFVLKYIQILLQTFCIRLLSNKIQGKKSTSVLTIFRVSASIINEVTMKQSTTENAVCVCVCVYINKGQHFRSCYSLLSFLVGQHEQSVIASSQFPSNLLSDISWHVTRLWVTLNSKKIFVEEPRKKQLLGEHRWLQEDNTEPAVERIDREERRRMEPTRDLVAGVVLTMLIYSWNMNVQIYLVRRSLQTPF